MIVRSAVSLFPYVLCFCANNVSFSSFESPKTLVKTFLLLRKLLSPPYFAFPVAVL